MIRVLYVSTSTTLGGAEKTLYTLASRLKRSAFEVPLAISVKPLGVYGERLCENGVQVASLEGGRWPGFGALKALKSLIARHRPDVVHALMYQAVQLCRLAKPQTGFKLVSSPRVSYRTRSWATLALDQALKGRDDLLISESEASRSYLIARQGYDPDKVRTIYNGVEPSPRPAPEEIARLRAEAGAGPEDFLIGAAGRLDRQKNHAALIRALAMLETLKPWRCVIWGEGPEREHLEALIRRLGLEDRVRLLGERPQVAPCLASLDLFVLPSLWEGLPNALLEAMAAGVCCAASAVDGVGEILRDGENGFLFPADDAKAVAQSVLKAMGDDASRRQTAAAGQSEVAEKFSLSRMLDAYEAAYQEVLGR